MWVDRLRCRQGKGLGVDTKKPPIIDRRVAAGFVGFSRDIENSTDIPSMSINALRPFTPASLVSFSAGGTFPSIALKGVSRNARDSIGFGGIFDRPIC